MVTYKIIPGFGGFYRAGDDGTIWTCRKVGGNTRRGRRAKDSWRLKKKFPVTPSGHLSVYLRRPNNKR